MSTYALIFGGLLLTILMGANNNKAYHDGTVVGAVAILLLLSSFIITGVAMMRQESPRLCLANFLLIAIFAGVLSAGFVAARDYLKRDRMLQHIRSLERALEKAAVPFTPFREARR